METTLDRRRGPLDLWRGEDGQLWVRSQAGQTAVRPVRCFPWSEPGRFVSLRDAEDEEATPLRDFSDAGATTFSTSLAKEHGRIEYRGFKGLRGISWSARAARQD